MKRPAALLLLLLAAPAAGQQRFRYGKDTTITTGVKLWRSAWSSVAFTGTTQSIYKDSIAVIPSAALRYKRFEASAAATFTGNHSFPGSSVQAKRQEADLSLGWYVHPSVALSVGYKGIFYTQKTAAGSAATRMHGAVLGVAASAPLAAGWSLTGSLGAGALNVRREAFGTTDTAFYESVEAGFSWKSDRLPLGASFGYKFQAADSKVKAPPYSGQRAVDSMRGPAAGLSLSF